MDDQLRTNKVGPKLYPFFLWRTAANSAAVKLPETLIGAAVGVLQISDSSFHTSQVDSRSAPSYFPFLRRCAVMALAGMGQ